LLLHENQIKYFGNKYILHKKKDGKEGVVVDLVLSKATQHFFCPFAKIYPRSLSSHTPFFIIFTA
jgi:hypothetical protein